MRTSSYLFFAILALPIAAGTVRAQDKENEELTRAKSTLKAILDGMDDLTLTIAVVEDDKTFETGLPKIEEKIKAIKKLYNDAGSIDRTRLSKKEDQALEDEISKYKRLLRDRVKDLTREIVRVDKIDPAKLKSENKRKFIRTVRGLRP